MVTLAPGTRFGPFHVGATLGAGGMGVVYRARDSRLDREVALKLLLPDIAADPDRLARFEREAQLLASLNHPNIAAIHGLEDVGGVRALVLELVEGPTIADRIAQGPIPLAEALSIAEQIAGALAAAHEQGIIHRDLKPANIKIRPDGAVKVLDFGLAKATDPSAAKNDATASPTMSRHATMAGMILGTAAYMSPEQASGKPVDKRADIWAFRVVLWEMVTGRRLFDGETVSHVLAAVLTQSPDLSRAPARVRRLLERCLEKDPRRRLRDIGDAMSLVDDPAAHPHRGHLRRWTATIPWATTGVLAVALGGAALWLRPGDAIGPADMVAVRLQLERPSVDPYNNAALAFAVSPDGRLLAHYTTGGDGRATLFVQTLATGERREVPGSAVLSPIAPFWSPDSRQVAYAAIPRMLVFDVLTGTTRQLCDCRFRGGSWNHDGTILLGSSPAESQPVRRLSLEDRVPIPVPVTDAAGGEQDIRPLFLPDGRRFVFTRLRPDGVAQTYLGTLDGDAPARLAEGSRSLFATLPDGLGPHLLGIDAAGLVAQPFDTGTMTVTGPPIVVVAGAAAASASANGVLATSAPAGRPVTVPTWFDRTGAPRGVIGPPGTIEGVALAADGRRLAVQETGEAGSGIWVRDGEGFNRRVGSDVGAAPVWSSDGTRVLVASRLDGIVNVFERDAEGSGREVRLFHAERNAFSNDWSRDGRWMIFTLPKTGTDMDLDLWVVPTDRDASRTPAPYVTSPVREAQAEFSPDGRFVAYTSLGNGDPEVYVQPFPNPAGGKWLVSSNGGSEPRWSRDGTELFYFAGQTLMAVPVSLHPTFSVGTPARLFDAPVQPWYTNDSDRWQVAPDGRRFLLLVPANGTAAPPLDVVVNWPALLRK